MLALEVFRPDEMILVMNKKKNKNLIKSMGLKQSKKTAAQVQALKERQKDNPYLNVTEDSIESLEEDQDDSKEEIKEDDANKKKKVGQGGLKQMFEQKKAEIRLRQGETKKLTAQQKIERQADENVSKPIVIKKFKNRDNIISKINDDFGLNYLPGLPKHSAGLVDEEDIEKNAILNNTMAIETRLDSLNITQNMSEAPTNKKQTDDTDKDFGLGMTQFLDYKSQYDDRRTKSDGNFLQDLQPSGQQRKVLKNKITS